VTPTTRTAGRNRRRWRSPGSAAGTTPPSGEAPDRRARRQPGTGPGDEPVAPRGPC